MEDKQKTKEQLITELSEMRRRVDELEALVINNTHTEEALQVCEARLKEVQQLAKIAQWEVNLQSGKVSWSDEDYRILGYQPGEIEPSWDLFLEHIHPEDMPIIVANREKLLAEGFIEVEYRIIQKNGDVRFVYSKNKIEYDNSGNALIIRGILQDITERKLAEAVKEKLLAELNRKQEKEGK
jgi:PAS domain S-box-containing protein